MSGKARFFGCIFLFCCEKHYSSGYCKKHYNTIYKKEHKIEINKQRQLYRLKNKECIKKYRISKKIYTKKYNQEYYINHKNIPEYIKANKERYKKWYIKMMSDPILKKRRSEIAKKSFRKRLQLWEFIIPKKTLCQVCGKIIFFNNGNYKEAIHLDHKTENLPIKISPVVWLIKNKPTPQNITLWKSCNFGFLCFRCNKCIPTCNREKWVSQVYQYVFGNNAQLRGE